MDATQHDDAPLDLPPPRVLAAIADGMIDEMGDHT